MRENRNVILTVSAVTLFFFGFLYTWSIFKTAMIPDLPWTSSQISLAYTVAMVGFALGNLVVGLLPVKKTENMRKILIGVTIMAGAGMMLSGSIEHLWQLYLCYGVMFGFGVGFLYNAWISMNMSWFADRRGVATGVLLMGFGITSLIFSFFSDRFLGEDAVLGWRGSFHVIGLVVMIVGLAALFFYRQAPPAQKKTGLKKSQRDVSPGQMIKSGSFWAYTVWKFIFMLVGISVAGYATTIAVVLFLKQNPAETLNTINNLTVSTPFGSGTVLRMAAIGGSLFSVGNGFCRVPMGMLNDKIGVGKTMVLICILEIAGAFLAFMGLGTLSFPLVTVGLFLLGVGYGGVATEGPVFMGEMYGTAHVRANMGVNAVTTVPAVLIGSRLISHIYENSGDFRNFFVITMILGCVALAAAAGILKMSAGEKGNT